MNGTQGLLKAPDDVGIQVHRVAGDYCWTAEQIAAIRSLIQERTWSMDGEETMTIDFKDLRWFCY